MDELEFKQNPLEYSPSFQREVRQKTGWENLEKEKPQPILPTEGESAVGEGVLTHVLQDYHKVTGILEDFIKSLEHKLKSIPLKFDGHWTEDLLRAKKELGLSNKESLNVFDYKVALQNSETAAGDFLINLIEMEIQDVNGSLEMELYGEAIEIRAEMKLIDTYIQQMIHPILSFKETKEEGWEDLLLKKEEAWGEKKKKALKESKKSNDAYLNSLLFEPSLVPKTRSMIHFSDKEYDSIRHEMNQLDNTLSVVSQRANDTIELTRKMNMLLSKKVDKTEVLTELFSLAEDEYEENESLSNMKLMLKVSVDVYNQEKNQYKNNLRNTYSITKQKSLLSELAIEEELFRKKTLSIMHHMRGYQKDLSHETTQLFNQISFGIKQNETKRKEKMYETFLLNQATSILRKQKLENVDKKDIARKGYKIAVDEIERRLSR